MNEELKTLLEEADEKDFVDCLKENFRNDSDSYFKMLSELYYNDKSHYRALSKGCQAAMIIYLKMRVR